MKNSVINDYDDRLSDAAYMITPCGVQVGTVMVHQDAMVTLAVEDKDGNVIGYEVTHEHNVVYKIKI